MIIQHIPCKQTLVCHVAVESNLYFNYASVLLHCIDEVMTRVACRPYILIKSFDQHGSLHVLFDIKIIQLLWSILNMYLHTSQKCWDWQLDDLDNKQDMQEAIAIKWMNQSKWRTYYTRYYCIDGMTKYTGVAKIQITLYCNMANPSSFARYCCIIIRMTIDHWCCLFAFDLTSYNLWVNMLGT